MAWRYRYEVERKECGHCHGHWFRVIRYPRRRDGLGKGVFLKSETCDCVMRGHFTSWGGALTWEVPEGSICVWEEE